MRPRMGAELRQRLEEVVVTTLDRKDFDEKVMTAGVIDEVTAWFLDDRTVERAAKAYVATTGKEWDDVTTYVKDHHRRTMRLVLAKLLQEEE